MKTEMIFFLIVTLIFPFHVFALPQNGTVVHGAAAILEPDAVNMRIEQQTDQAIINRDSFSIAQPETVQFNQPGHPSIALNSVTGVDPSIIGLFPAKGKVCVINSNGLLTEVAGTSEANFFNEDRKVSVFFPLEDILLKSGVATPPILIIHKEHRVLLRRNALERFIIKSISFLKKNFLAWSLHRSDEAIRLFVEETIRFGERYNVNKEINLQKLMHYQIEYSFEIPLSGYLQKRLAEKDMNETQRVERFYFGLIKNQNFVEINLE